MKRFRIIGLILLFLASVLSAQSSIQAIVGGTLVNTNGSAPLKNAIILMEKGRIIRVGSSEETRVPGEAHIIDARGKWIIPGLIDAHVHFFQSGGLYTRPDVIDLRKYVPYETQELMEIRERLPDTFARYLRCGITSVVDVGGPMWNFQVRKLSHELGLAPRVAVAGPLISTYQPQKLTTDDPPVIRVNSIEEARQLVRRQLEMKPDLIKIWFIVFLDQKPEDHLPLVRAAIEESHKQGIRVAVHATQLETARAAVMAGADILVHSVTDKEVDENFVRLLKQKNIIYIPTLVVFEGYAEVLSQQIKLTTPEYEVGNPFIISTLFDLRTLPAEDIPEDVLNRIQNAEPITTNPVLLKNLKLLNDAGVTIAAGTDAGNIGTLHGPAIFHELELMAEAGLSPAEILTAATFHGARVMGREKELGTVEVGKLADMVILNSNPLQDILNTSDIFLVIKGGIVYEPQQILPKIPQEIVQQQVNAYNARDIEAFLACYDPAVKIYAHPDSLLLSGKEEMRRVYKPFFQKAPGLHARIVKRIVLGNFVVDREKVTGLPDNQIVDVVAIYQLENGLIHRVWFIQE